MNLNTFLVSLLRFNKIIENMKLEKLKKEFDGKGEVSGFKFKQILSLENVYVYEVSTSETRKHYEIFKKKAVNKIKFDKQLGEIKELDELKETYPKSKSFGKWAFNRFTKEKAIHFANELNERINVNRSNARKSNKAQGC